MPIVRIPALQLRLESGGQLPGGGRGALAAGG